MAGVLVFSAAGQAEAEPAAPVENARLDPVGGALGVVGEDARWQTDGDASAVVSLDLPAPGMLSVVVRAANDADLDLTIADARGVAYAGGYFDNDPRALPGGESGAVLLPAGRVNVVVRSWDGAATGRLRTAWLALPDAAQTPVASEAFLAAVAVADGASVVTPLPPKVRLTDRTVLYLPPRADAGTIGLTFDPPPGDVLQLGVYPSNRPWEQVFDYELGEGTFDLSAAAGVGHFLVMEQWGDGMLPLTLTRRDVNPLKGAAQQPDATDPVDPAATRRAPR